MIKILKSGINSPEEIFSHTTPTSDVSDIVADIISQVRKNGDKALFMYAEKFDKAVLSSIEVTKEEIDEAFTLVEPEFVEILKEAAENIKSFHSRQVKNSFIISETIISITAFSTIFS